MPGRDSAEAGREQCKRMTQFCAVPTPSQRSDDAGGSGGSFWGYFSFESAGLARVRYMSNFSLFLRISILGEPVCGSLDVLRILFLNNNKPSSPALVFPHWVFPGTLVLNICVICCMCMMFSK